MISRARSSSSGMKCVGGKDDFLRIAKVGGDLGEAEPG